MRIATLFVIVLTVALTTLPASAQPRDRELSDYVRDTWEVTNLTDEAAREMFELDYEGIPYRSWISFFFAAPDVLEPLGQREYAKAAEAAGNIAAERAFDHMLARLGMLGVSATVQLAVLPIEWGLGAFERAVTDRAFQNQASLYMEAREHHSASEIMQARPAELLTGNRNPMTKDDHGWLYRRAPAQHVPGMTPQEMYSYAEALWRAQQLRDDVAPSEAAVAAAFRRHLTSDGIGAEEARGRLSELNVDYSPDEFVDAAYEGDSLVAALFIVGGMSPDVRRSWDASTPLVAAAGNGHLEIVKLLARAGGDVNYRSDRGNSPLCAAALGEHLETANWLLSAGADLFVHENGWGSTGLACAPWYGTLSLDILLALLESTGRMPRAEVFAHVYSRPFMKAQCEDQQPPGWNAHTDRHFVWSDDRSKVAFTRCSGGDPERKACFVFVVDPYGDQPAQPTIGECSGGYAAIAMRMNELLVGNGWSIGVYDLIKQEIRWTFDGFNAVLSPAGTQIALIRRDRRSANLWIVDSDGSNSRNLTNFDEVSLGNPELEWVGEDVIRFQMNHNDGVWEIRSDGSGLMKAE